MSWLSNQLSSIADITKRNVLKPVANTYNRNKSAILDAAAMAAIAAATVGSGGTATPAAVALAGGAGALGGALQGSEQDAKRHEEQRQLNNKAGAAVDLTNLVGDIGGSPTIPGRPTDTTPVVMNPVTGQPVPITDPAAKDLISGGQVVIDPITGKPVRSGSPADLISNPGAISGNSPTGEGKILDVNSNLNYTPGEQNPALGQRVSEIIGTGNTDAEKSARQVAAANDLVMQLSTGTLNTQAADRKQQIADLSMLLTNQAKTQYERQLPGLYEDLNTRGLLRSSDLGNQMAMKQQQSYEDVAQQLAKQQLGYNDEYITGMGNIANQYNSGVGSALQREQSLQDFANQTAASLKLGQAVTPVQPSGKSGMSTATNALGLTAGLNSLGTGMATKAGPKK